MRKTKNKEGNFAELPSSKSGFVVSEPDYLLPYGGVIFLRSQVLAYTPPRQDVE
jgi:hypothetical protein